MQELFSAYQERADQIANAIQQSEALATFLDTEEETDYKAIVQAYEPYMHQLYEQVAAEHPLQLTALELAFLDPSFEGLYMPKLLGYSVLRGRVNEHLKYVRPQEQFRQVILAMAKSANFEYIAGRTGQGVQVGFALSSDIWITNLINEMQSKRAKNYFLTQKQDKFRDLDERLRAHKIYAKQFVNFNFATAKFPADRTEFLIEFADLRDFLIYRVTHDLDNSSIVTPLLALINDQNYFDQEGYNDIVLIASVFMRFNDKDGMQVAARLNTQRKAEDFDEQFFQFILALLDRGLGFNQDLHGRLHPAVDRSIDDEFLQYMDVLQELYTKGYLHQDTLDAVNKFQTRHEGLSLPNQAIRQLFLYSFDKGIQALGVDQYAEYFEWTKTFTSYMSLFDNQKFNQSIKETSLVYIKKLLKHYTDKRGRDYQDIKKFVKAYFLDMGFMTEKQLVELFKTKRKKKVVAAS